MIINKDMVVETTTVTGEGVILFSTPSISKQT